MQKEAPAMVPLLFEIRPPHPPASAGTFSLWEKVDRRFGLFLPLPAQCRAGLLRHFGNDLAHHSFNFRVGQSLFARLQSHAHRH